MAETADRRPNPFHDDQDELSPAPVDGGVDPLLALSQIVAGDAAAPSAGQVPPTVPVSAEPGQTDTFDLEQALTAELGLDDTVAVAAQEPIGLSGQQTLLPAVDQTAAPSDYSATDEPPLTAAWPMVDGADGPADPLGDTIADVAPIEPAPQLATVEDVPSISLEDELEALLSDAAGVPQVPQPDAAPAELIDHTAEPEMAQPVDVTAAIEPPMDQATTADTVDPSFEQPVSDGADVSYAPPVATDEMVAEPALPLVSDPGMVEPFDANDLIAAIEPPMDQATTDDAVDPSFEQPVSDAADVPYARPVVTDEMVSDPAQPSVSDHAMTEPFDADDALEQAAFASAFETEMSAQDAVLGAADDQSQLFEPPQPAIEPAVADMRPEPGHENSADETGLEAMATAVEPAPHTDAPEPATLDPVDELVAIMGLDPREAHGAEAAPVADPQSEQPPVPDLSALDAEFESALARDLPDYAEPQQHQEPIASVPDNTQPSVGAPVLDTVDMSSFDDVEPAGFSVPEFDESAAPAAQSDAFADLEDELAGMFGDDEQTAGATTTAVVAGAGVAVAAAASQSTDQIAGFDTEQFEAELARDMEFVNHDLDAARSDADDGAADNEAVSDDAGHGSGTTNKGRRGAMIGLIVGGLAVAGVVGVLAMAGQRDGADDGPVLVEADAEPVKIQPEDPGGTTVPNQDRAVFAEGEATAPAQETLVSTTEEPLDIATAPAETLPSAVAAGEKAEDRLTAGGTETTAAEPIATITPRRVRTLIVRPDGTLEERAVPEPAAPIDTVVSNAVPDATDSGSQPASETVASDAGAAGATAPVAAVAEPSSAEPTQSVSTAPQEPVVADAATNSGSAAVAPETNAQEVALASTAASEAAPVVVRRVQTTSATPPIIRDRPADQPVNVINRTQTQQVAAVDARPAAPAPVTATTSSSGFTVQLAALPSEAAARDTAGRLSRQYGSLIGGRGVTIQRAEVDGRGTFYRIRVAASDSADATGLCNQIKASGGNCFVAR